VSNLNCNPPVMSALTSFTITKKKFKYKRRDTDQHQMESIKVISPVKLQHLSSILYNLKLISKKCSSSLIITKIINNPQSILQT